VIEFLLRDIADSFEDEEGFEEVPQDEEVIVGRALLVSPIGEDLLFKLRGE